MNTELTIEQEDELLRADMSAIESSTNDLGEENQDEQEIVNQDEQEVAEPKKKSNVAKLLAQRNQFEAERDEANKRIAELLEKGEGGSEEYMEKLMERKIAEKLEVQDFFARNPQAKELREELDAYRAENPNLSYDRALKFYLAETNPTALLEEQVQNQQNSNIYNTAGRVPQSLRSNSQKLTYSDEELDGLIKAGKIRI